MAFAIPLLLTRSISVDMSEAPAPEYVSAYTKPGEGISFKCECRKPGLPI